ncbi:MAG TPA: PQQ-binding-like beta-propeller repeat protein [Pilimelia sp.]|nr:PQQ-binding-like beta-propeller repeat protein [Pilimelia sp.]
MPHITTSAAGQPGRGRWRWAAASALVAAVVVGLGGSASPTGGPARDPTGPGPGVLAAVWTHPLRFVGLGFDEGSRLDTASGTLLRWSGSQLWALDVRTGRIRWTQQVDDARRGPRAFVDKVVVGDGVVVVTGGVRPAEPPVLTTGFRVSDGRRMWRVRNSHPVTAEGHLLVSRPDDGSLSGIDATTGAVRWTSRLPAGCTTLAERADEVIALVLACGADRLVMALAGHSGRKIWQVPLPAAGPASDFLQVRGSAVLWGNKDDFRLVNAAGRVVATHQPGLKPGRTDLLAAADVALLRTHDGHPGPGLLTAVDLATGAIRWRTTTTAYEMVLARDAAYAVAKLPDPLLPAALMVMDLSTGRVTATATHLVGSVPGTPNFSVLGVADGLLLIRRVTSSGSGSTTVDVTAYRTVTPVPAGYAGAAGPADWPDACGLLSAADLAAAVPGVRYRAFPRAVADPAPGLPRAVTCNYQAAPVTGPAVGVSVRWVGSDVAQAAGLMADPSAWHNGTANPIDGADEAVAVSSGSPVVHIEVILRVGRRIVSVSWTGDVRSHDPLACHTLAARIAAHLHALPG